MDKDIFEILTEQALNERFGSIVLEDAQYQGAQQEIDKAIEQYSALGLPGEQKFIVDKLISAHTKSGSCYARAAYQQGIRDCASLLWEMRLLKKETREDNEA